MRRSRPRGSRLWGRTWMVSNGNSANSGGFAAKKRKGRKRRKNRRAEGGGYGPSQTHGLESPCHVAWAFQPMSGRPRIAPVAYSCARDLTAGGRQRTDDDSAW